MKHSNLPNKEIHEWYVPPAKFANIPSKSFVSFIKLIGVDSQQIESILNIPFVTVQSRGGLSAIIDWKVRRSLLMCKD